MKMQSVNLFLPQHKCKLCICESADNTSRERMGEYYLKKGRDGRRKWWWVARRGGGRTLIIIQVFCCQSLVTCYIYSTIIYNSTFSNQNCLFSHKSCTYSSNKWIIQIAITFVPCVVQRVILLILAKHSHLILKDCRYLIQNRHSLLPFIFPKECSCYTKEKPYWFFNIVLIVSNIWRIGQSFDHAELPFPLLDSVVYSCRD